MVAGTTDGWGAIGYLDDLDILVAKLDPGGEHAWTQKLSLGNDPGDKERATSVAETANGDLFVAGVTTSAGAGGADLFVARLTAAGELSWMRTYGGVGDDITSPVPTIATECIEGCLGEACQN